MSSFYADFHHLHLKFAGRVATVATFANLADIQDPPVGETRWVEDEKALYFWDGAAWITGSASFFDTLTVNNLTVNNLAYLNANVVEVGDNLIVLNNDVVGAPTENGGIIINRGTSPDAVLYWDETDDTWYAGTEGNVEPFPGASPAFKFTRQGAVPSDTWLQVDGIPSNLTGHRMPFDGRVKEIFVDSSSSSTYDIQLYQHDHVTYTLLTTVSISSAYGTSTTLTGVNFTSGNNLAAKLSSGSATDVSVGIRLSKS